MPRQNERSVVLTLTDREKWLIIAIRERFRFGDVTIVMRDGVPQRIKRAFETEDPVDA